VSSFAEVQQLLEQKLATLVTAAEVHWENAPFTPPTDGSPWYRVTFMPGTPFRGTLGENGFSELRGIFQVSVFYPAGGGSGTARAKADAIVSLFKSGTSLVGSSLSLLVEMSWREAALNEPDWYHVPVRVRWRALSNEV